MDWQEYQESTTVRLDWTIRGLKQLFDSSKGETKSKAVKSVKFGGGRWQILFYPNSGTENGQFVSLYLSCEPTPEEKDDAIDGKWVRSGLYRFNFELRNLSKTMLFSQKEAVDHSFSWKTANWGWAQFARRETIYHQPNTIRTNDAFLISCTITSSPTVPSVPPRVPHRSVPKELLDVVGTLLDNPTYSDVEFILPRRRSGGRKLRRIFAARYILSRAEYFKTMFSSDFSEGASQDMDIFIGQSYIVSNCDNGVDSAAHIDMQHFDDSDDEDEAALSEFDDGDDMEDYDVRSTDDTRTTANSEEMNPPTANEKSEEMLAISLPDRCTSSGSDDRSLQIELSEPTSPRWKDKQIGTDNVHASSTPTGSGSLPKCITKTQERMHRVVVKDVAYTTYRAVLYYLYTDSIIFAPLASTFLMPVPEAGHSTSQSSAPRAQGEGQNVNAALGNRPIAHREHSEIGPTTRIAWIRQWERQNPGKPAPCSAKAAYRVADKLGLTELKERAFQHIAKFLTIHNVPYEMFSSFSSTFEDVRKTQVAFFLEHWDEIRTSHSMQTVWQQIRAGRHPGFEEVWPLIAMNLEFRPRVPNTADDGNIEGTGEVTR